MSGQAYGLNRQEESWQVNIGGQMALNAVNEDKPVCFYSGELCSGMFQNWLMLQAAGERYLNGYVDVTGAERWQVDAYAERRN